MEEEERAVFVSSLPLVSGAVHHEQEGRSWGHWYVAVRGEILGFATDPRGRKHLSRTLSLIKNESWGIEGD